MLRARPDKITPEGLYITRRQFLASLGLVSMTFFAACTKVSSTLPSTSTKLFCDGTLVKQITDELGDNLTSCKDITTYNNFYEFSFNKDDVVKLAAHFKDSPWTVEVSGLVGKPDSFSVIELIKKYQPVERIYRLRCVEGWSAVVPWLGFPLAKLLKDVQPLPEAKFVRFTGMYDPVSLPGQKETDFSWPYQEGLRFDEAMHNLTILATGLYGKPLPPQDGAPIRLVVPWKYGYKNIKSIVKIELVADQPATFWNIYAPSVYGFYANVNPSVSDPRWSQSSERRLGELTRRHTLPFNGYSEVAELYAGMDLGNYF